MSNVIACQNCNTEYDGRFAEPGAKFRCTTCGSVVAVSVHHNPNPVVQPQAGGVELIRGGSSTFGAPVGYSQQPYVPAASRAPAASPYAPMAAPVAPPAINAPAPASTWIPNTSMPTVRSHGISILLWIVTFGLYQLVWTYKLHAEHPRRKDIDTSAGMALAGLLVPSAAAVLFIVIGCISLVTDTGGFDHHRHTMSAVHSGGVSAATVTMFVLGAVCLFGSMFWKYRLFTRLSDRLNTLASTLPPGQTAAPKVSRGLAKWHVLTEIISLPVCWVPGLGAVVSMTSMGLGIGWWCQAQSVSNALAQNALTAGQQNAFAGQARVAPQAPTYGRQTF